MPYLDCIVFLSKPSLASLLICCSEGLVGLRSTQHTLPAILTVHVPDHEVITHHLTQLLIQVDNLHSAGCCQLLSREGNLQQISLAMGSRSSLAAGHVTAAEKTTNVSFQLAHIIAAWESGL